GLHQIIETRPGRAAAAAAISGEVNADDARVHIGELRVGQTELRRQVAAQIVEHGIAGLDELAKDLLAFGLLEVEAEAALVAVEGFVEVAVAWSEEQRPARAAHVAAFLEVFDLDHLGAEVGQVQRSERPGAILFDRDDAYAGQRQTHARFLSINCLAMMIRCSSLVPSPMTRSGASR